MNNQQNKQHQSIFNIQPNDHGSNNILNVLKSPQFAGGITFKDNSNTNQMLKDINKPSQVKLDREIFGLNGLAKNVNYRSKSLIRSNFGGNFQTNDKSMLAENFSISNSRDLSIPKSILEETNQRFYFRKRHKKNLDNKEFMTLNQSPKREEESKSPLFPFNVLILIL